LCSDRRYIMADVVVENTIPDAYVARIVAALPKVVGSHVTVSLRGFQNASDGSDLDGSCDFNLPTIVGETSMQMGKRIMRHLMLAVCRAVEVGEDKIRADSDHAAVTPPTSDLPDDAVI
jgi:hypothetical protein